MRNCGDENKRVQFFILQRSCSRFYKWLAVTFVYENRMNITTDFLAEFKRTNFRTE